MPGRTLRGIIIGSDPPKVTSPTPILWAATLGKPPLPPELQGRKPAVPIGLVTSRQAASSLDDLVRGPRLLTTLHHFTALPYPSSLEVSNPCILPSGRSDVFDRQETRHLHEHYLLVAVTQSGQTPSPRER